MPKDLHTIAVRPERRAVLEAFGTLPDEAFNFQLASITQIGREAGGFQRDSRVALEHLTAVIDAYFERLRP